MKKIFLAALLAVTVIACKKDPDEPAPTPTPTPAATTGSLKLEFEAMVGDSDLVFNTEYYKNANNDSFTVSIFRYYISNVVLTKSDNSTYVVPNSYFKVDHNTTGKNIVTMSSIPSANYKSVQFIIGIDSTRNVSGAQSGDLAVSDMFWSWSTGYIFGKFEGTSPKSVAVGNSLTYHIGGFNSPNSGIRTVNLSFGSSTANVSSSVTPEVHITSDLAKWFNGAGGMIDFAALNTIMMPGANSVKIANNYQAMFTFEHVHN